jgi:hypothetical protein
VFKPARGLMRDRIREAPLRASLKRRKIIRLVASPPMRELLLSAKHLFVAAKLSGEPLMDGLVMFGGTHGAAVSGANNQIPRGARSD